MDKHIIIIKKNTWKMMMRNKRQEKILLKNPIKKEKNTILIGRKRAIQMPLMKVRPKKETYMKIKVVLHLEKNYEIMNDPLKSIFRYFISIKTIFLSNTSITSIEF